MNYKPLLAAAKGQGLSNYTPVWFMRQAGRYLPEYMSIKKQVEADGGNFFTMCYNPKIASAITLQPLQRYDVDAAIVFADILVILDAMGWPVDFVKEHGPLLEVLENKSQLDNLLLKDEKLDKIMETIALTKTNIAKNKTVIGFAGSPFTVALYALSGGKIVNNIDLKAKIISNPDFDALCEVLIENTYYYLKKQIEAGAEVIKLFESHASFATFDEESFIKYVILPNKKIISHLRADYPDVPVIFFPRGSGLYYSILREQIPYNVLAIDENVPINFASEVLQKQQQNIIQGNLDNHILCYGSKERIQYASLQS